EYVKARPEERKRKRDFPGVSLHFEGPLRPPSPDGPRRRVPNGFITAVLDSPALNSLIRFRPELAGEVLLAVCIEEPRPRDYRHPVPFFDDFGLTHWKNGYPPMYFKGPFLSFLRTAPETGLATIIRLVNHATERWLDARVGRVPTALERRSHSL